MKKDIIIVLVAVLIITVLITGTNFQSVDEYYLTHADDITEESEVVTVCIDCSSVLDAIPERLKEYIPDNGIILEETKTVLRKEDSVFDLTYRIVRNKKIQFDFDGPESNAYGSAYVKGIGYLYEFDCGAGSGWLYLVNDEVPQVGSSSYKPKDGDKIEWVYTKLLGKDIQRVQTGGEE